MGTQTKIPSHPIVRRSPRNSTKPIWFSPDPTKKYAAKTLKKKKKKGDTLAANGKTASHNNRSSTTDGLPLGANAVKFVSQHNAKVMKESVNKKLHAVLKSPSLLVKNPEAICNPSGNDNDDRVMSPPETANKAGAETGFPTRYATEPIVMVRGRLNTGPVKVKKPQQGNTHSETPPQ